MYFGYLRSQGSRVVLRTEVLEAFAAQPVYTLLEKVCLDLLELVSDKTLTWVKRGAQEG